MQVLGKARKRAHRFPIPIRRHGHKNLRRPNVYTASVRSHHRQTPFQLTVLPFLRLRHGLPPQLSSATSQACKKWKSIKRDHHNTNCRCASPMLWCTGLGSNSLTGSPKRNTNGCATYTYRCRLPFFTPNPGQFWGRGLRQFLFVIGLDAGQLGYSLKTEGNGPVSPPTHPSTPRATCGTVLIVLVL